MERTTRLTQLRRIQELVSAQSVQEEPPKRVRIPYYGCTRAITPQMAHPSRWIEHLSMNESESND